MNRNFFIIRTSITLASIFLQDVRCLARPDVLRCTIHNGDGFYVNCSGRNLTSVPTSLPHDVTNLDLSRNRISDVSSGALRVYGDLRVLDVSDNALERVDRSALPTSLLTLRMSHNSITSVCIQRGI
jgi:hypothetical protein